MNIQHIQTAIKTSMPLTAYLGRLEMQAMLEEARQSGFDVTMHTAEPDLHRLEFNGCALFQVDSESHFAMGERRAEVKPSA
jgi:hypothetical protein